jgi:vitamin B12/bleomycin/antimicrobial peptide transport system ATP-binding/permease protein
MILKDCWNNLPKAKVSASVLVLLAIISSEIVLTCLIPEWRNIFYGALAVKSLGIFKQSIIYFVILITSLTVVQSLKTWLAQKLALKFRTQMVNILTNKWFNAQNIEQIDNADQRINQDTDICTSTTIAVILECLISGAIVISLFIETFSKLNLVFASGVYTLIVVLGAILFRQVLIVREINRQKAEANHRFSLAELRCGQGSVLNSLTIYEQVKTTCLAQIKTLMHFSIFNRSQNNFSSVAAYLVLAPAFFGGVITLGQFMGDVAIFELLVINATILVQLYPDITRASASWIRIKEFYGRLSA